MTEPSKTMTSAVPRKGTANGGTARSPFTRAYRDLKPRVSSRFRGATVTMDTPAQGDYACVPSSAARVVSFRPRYTTRFA